MNKLKLIEGINKIVNFITNGSVTAYGRTYEGHPAFYLLHSKEEFDKELQSIIKDKDNYDRYDLYYYFSYMFKYMLNQYDSHTRLFFTDDSKIPVKIRIFDNVPYMIDSSEKYSGYKGARIIGINGFDINNINSELEKIICYASDSFLKLKLEDSLINPNIIKSLPIIDNNSSSIIFNTDKGDIEFDLNNLDIYVDKSIKQNYTLETNDNTAIITYNSCCDEEGMKKLVDRLNNISMENYIVDLRGNNGGDSSINKHLIEYLKGKNVIVLCDERVFSSARMCAIDLKNIGAKLIGIGPATPISCFGNCVMRKNYPDAGLFISVSATYWYYDENYMCTGFYKDDFYEALKNNPKILDLVFLNVDTTCEKSLNDYLDNTDSVMDYALSLFGKNIKKI